MNKLENISIYTQNEHIIVDLSELNGNSIVSVFNGNGILVKTIQSRGNEKLTITLPNKGFYLVKVQNGDKFQIQKVIIF